MYHNADNGSYKSNEGRHLCLLFASIAWFPVSFKFGHLQPVSLSSTLGGCPPYIPTEVFNIHLHCCKTFNGHLIQKNIFFSSSFRDFESELGAKNGRNGRRHGEIGGKPTAARGTFSLLRCCGAQARLPRYQGSLATIGNVEPLIILMCSHG